MKEGFEFFFGEKTDFGYIEQTGSYYIYIIYIYIVRYEYRNSRTVDNREVWMVPLNSPHETDLEKC